METEENNPKCNVADAFNGPENAHQVRTKEPRNKASKIYNKITIFGAMRYDYCGVFCVRFTGERQKYIYFGIRSRRNNVKYEICTQTAPQTHTRPVRL